MPIPIKKTLEETSRWFSHIDPVKNRVPSEATKNTLNSWNILLFVGIRKSLTGRVREFVCI